MLELLPQAQSYARPLLTNFRVGAVVRGASGALYLGANLEFPGQGLHQTVHAEQAALSNAFMHDETGVVALAVSAPPCGHCRQFLYEFCEGRDIPIFMPGQQPITLTSLLPQPFGPRDLKVMQGPLSRTKPNGQKDKDELVHAALGAASKAYAPYSASPSGIAIRTRRGAVYAGSYIENAAFNPSLAPLQVALAAAALENEVFSDIAYAVLAEGDKNAVSQLSSTRALLSAVAPLAEFRLFPYSK